MILRPSSPSLKTSSSTEPPDISAVKSPVGSPHCGLEQNAVPFPGIIGISRTDTVLEPVFAFSDDNSWALLAQGRVRLENHIDDRLDTARRVTP